MIPIAGPWITQHEIDAVTCAVSNGWYEHHDYYQHEFEAAFAEYIGVEHAVSLPSCTSAIHLALVALGVGPGDEVIVPECTWIATAAPISYVGATPVFCDIEPDTWCMSVESLKACITERTKAVIPVDLYGGMPDYWAIRGECVLSGVPIVEDAAQAAGSRFETAHFRDNEGEPVTLGPAFKPASGAWGDIGVFSFHGSKTITTGEGGMLVTDSDAIRDRVLHLRDHGRKPGSYINDEVAFKYKMSAMQAALGLAQLQRIDEIVAKKREIFSWYRDELADTGLQMNHEPAETLNTYWMVTVILPRGVDRDGVRAHLRERGIDTRPMFAPLSWLDMYECNPRGNPVAYDICFRGLNLPSALALTRENVRYVCNALREVLP